MAVPTPEWFAAEYGIAIATLDPERPPPAEVLASLSPATCREHQVVPVTLEGGVLAIAVADPSDIFALDRIAHQTGRSLIGALGVRVAEPQRVAAAIERWYPAEGSADEPPRGWNRSLRGANDHEPSH
jgi:type IV pilus assembly protein PilB